MTLLKDLINIPERVHQGDFVLKLSEGVTHAEATLRDYVVTPQLVDSFDNALGFIKQSVESGAIKDAPDILLTTPESLEGMLVSTRIDRSARFGHLRVVIADELHAFAADDRGWHLRAVLHRLQQYVPHEVQRIGLSATVSVHARYV